jgi:hypothetical protein
MTPAFLRAISLILFFIFYPYVASAQFGDLPFNFGEVTYADLDIKKYEKDTSAAAVVIQEFGVSWIDNTNDNNLLFRYYTKIKILKKAGLEQANVVIMLRKDSNRGDRLRQVKAASYNIENGSMNESRVAPRDIYSEVYNEYWDAKKFAIPNVRVGSVIEYEYTMETPFFAMNFKPWEFQSDIPKIASEYWATIPGNYQYNIALKGFLKLSKNESTKLKDCFTPGANKADCAQYKWGMKDVPAFVEEEYMTARKNFVSAITFELMEITHFDGRKDRVTKEWKDAEQELRQRSDFWAQMRKGEDILEPIEAQIGSTQDPLEKSKSIFQFVRLHFRWNEVNGIFSENGIRKAFDKGEGNVADINLSLIAALRAADLSVEPVILATRDKGFPTELFPVLSEFNYVIAKLTIGDRYFLLDATDDFLPFGVLPRRCLNDKGRVISDKSSEWIEIKAQERSKQFTVCKLKFDDDGILRGTIETTYSGYRGADHRRKITSFTSIQLFIDDLSNRFSNIEVTGHSIKNLDDSSAPLIETLEIEVEGIDLTQPLVAFNPFLLGRWTSNPFRSTERLFPVDFGVPFEELMVMNIELPKGYELTDTPDRVGILLPAGGGRFVYEARQLDGRVQFNSSLVITKSLYAAQEYFNLKEFFARVVQAQGYEVILKKQSAGN